MPNLYPNVEAEAASSVSNTANMMEYISVGEALKLVTPFKGDKREVLTFIANVGTAFEVIDPRNESTLFKFVLMRVSGEPRTAIAHRNLENWEELKEFFKTTYTEKRTLDYRANKLFSTKQSKVENVSEWIQRVQKLGSKFREAALQDWEVDERAGILTLADKLRNICFVQGLYSDRIQTIVRSRNHSTFDEMAETALDESAIFSKTERHKNSNSNSESLKCTNCHKLGHIASRCYLKERKEARVNQLLVKNENRENNGDVCYNCQGTGHIARHCRKPRKRIGKPGLISDRNGGSQYSGNVPRPSVSGSRPTVQSTQ